jgi:hypothetical protein
VVGRVNGEACRGPSGPRRSGTKFRGTDGKEEPRKCAATRCSSGSIVCFPARQSTSQPGPTRVVSTSTAPTSRIFIGPSLTDSRSRLEGGRRAKHVELGGTPGAPGVRVRRLHREAEVSFREQGVRESAGLCEDVDRVGHAIRRDTTRRRAPTALPEIRASGEVHPRSRPRRRQRSVIVGRQGTRARTADEYRGRCSERTVSRWEGR